MKLLVVVRPTNMQKGTPMPGTTEAANILIRSSSCVSNEPWILSGLSFSIHFSHDGRKNGFEKEMPLYLATHILILNHYLH